MHIIRERWLVISVLVLLFVAGNYVANHGEPVREVITLLYLVCGALVYLLYERAGWLGQFYLLDRPAETSSKSVQGVKSQHDHLIFASLSIYYIGYVALTGGDHSPLFCILYLPPVLAGIRYGPVAAIIVSVLLAAGYIGLNIGAVHHGMMFQAVALSFPVAGLFGSMLQTRLKDGLWSMSERVVELGALMDVSQMLEIAIDLKTTVNLLLINAQQVVDANVCAVYLLDASDWSMRLSASSADEHSSTFADSLTVQQLEAGKWRLTSDEVLWLRRSYEDGDSAARDIWPESQSQEGMFASLVGSEGVLGILYVGRKDPKHPFSVKDSAALRRYAMHVSMALQKARYQENLSLLAFRDQMTDLSNFRYFEQRLTDDLLRAKRYKQEVSLLLIDIDYFKKFNDDYGHKAGDALLKQFGFVLKECLRDSDLPARYGGEEFIVICPGTSGEEARSVAERIRSRVESTEFDIGQSLLGEDSRVKITVSLGSSSYPAHAIDPGSLVRQADRALYAAKERGRNVFVSCDDMPTVDETLAARSAA